LFAYAFLYYSYLSQSIIMTEVEHALQKHIE